MFERIFHDERVASIKIRKDTREHIKEQFPDLFGYIVIVEAKYGRNFGYSGDGVAHRTLVGVRKTVEEALDKLKFDLEVYEEGDTRPGRLDINEDYITVYDQDGEEIVCWSQEDWIKDPTLVAKIAQAIDSFYKMGVENVKAQYRKESEHNND